MRDPEGDDSTSLCILGVWWWITQNEYLYQYLYQHMCQVVRKEEWPHVRKRLVFKIFGSNSTHFQLMKSYCGINTPLPIKQAFSYVMSSLSYYIAEVLHTYTQELHMYTNRPWEASCKILTLTPLVWALAKALSIHNLKTKIWPPSLPMAIIAMSLKRWPIKGKYF